MLQLYYTMTTNPNWGDLLTSYAGSAITYDNIGNPTLYRVLGTPYTLSWTGRQLDSVNIMGMDNTTYTYNESGIRTSKNRNGTVYSYILDGSKILKETRGASTTLYYYYDDAGSVTGFTYNGTNYYYGKNIQSNVKYIYNTSGTVVVEYAYDAWGDLVSISGSLYNTVGSINPFRYRSYYYDTETGFYYLNSRYYDPNTGRFINADGIIGANQDLLSGNLFTYCSNNPVMFCDPSGRCCYGTCVDIDHDGIGDSVDPDHSKDNSKDKNNDGKDDLYGTPIDNSNTAVNEATSGGADRSFIQKLADFFRIFYDNSGSSSGGNNSSSKSVNASVQYKGESTTVYRGGDSFEIKSN